MTDFTFTSEAQCEFCGGHLSSSDEECDHDGQNVETHVFRRLNEGRESLVGVECTIQYKWEKLKDKIGDEWIAYEWIGTRETVETMLSGAWDSVDELPMREMSADAEV